MTSIKNQDVRAQCWLVANLDKVANEYPAGNKTADLVHRPAGDNAMLPVMNKVMKTVVVTVDGSQQKQQRTQAAAIAQGCAAAIALMMSLRREKSICFD